MSESDRAEWNDDGAYAAHADDCRHHEEIARLTDLLTVARQLREDAEADADRLAAALRCQPSHHTHQSPGVLLNATAVRRHALAAHDERRTE